MFTSVIGSYGIIRGASLYFEGLPDEGIVIDLIKRREWNQLDEVNYILKKYSL